MRKNHQRLTAETEAEQQRRSGPKVDDRDHSLSSQSDAPPWPSPPSRVKFSTFQQLTPIPRILRVLALSGVALVAVEASRVYAQQNPVTNPQALPPGNWREPVRKRLEKWREKLEQYHQGERDYRDGYIILHKMNHLYGVLREQDSPEAKAIAGEKEELLKAHPELRSLAGFKLSEEIDRQDLKIKSGEARERAATRWTPKDDEPIRVFGSNRLRRAVVRYQYRLDFFELPEGVQINVKPETSIYGLYRGAAEVPLSSLTPKRTLSFKRKVNISPGHFSGNHAVEENFLVCMDFMRGYVPKTEEEQRILAPRMDFHGVPWVNERGGYSQFCGVVSILGEIVFKFRFKQAFPGRLIRPITMSEDGRYAAIMIGERVFPRGIETERPFIGRPSEVWTWEYPKTVKKHPVENPDIDLHELFEQYRSKPSR